MPPRPRCSAIADRLILALCLAAWGSACAPEATAPESTLTAFVGATLVDGTGGPSRPDAVVLVEGERIVAVGSRGAVDVPGDATVVDVSGRWLVPGLIDAHVHFFESGRIYTKPGQIDLTHLVPYPDEVAWMKQRVPATLRAYLCAGVTTAVSVGGPRFEYEVRSAAQSIAAAPNVVVGHGPLTLVPAEVLFPPFDGDVSVRSVTDTESARTTVREAVAWGADLIKTGVLGGPFAAYEADYAAVHDAVVEAARVEGLRVTAHVTELEAARTLIEAGVDSLQHLPLDALVDEAFLRLAAERGVIVVPTLAVGPRNFVQPYDRSYDLLPIEEICGDPQVIASWYEVDDLPPLGGGFAELFAAGDGVPQQNIRRLHEAGIPLAAGSDAGNFGLLHGASLHYELDRMQAAGIPAADLLVAATLHAARVGGVGAEVGSVEVEKRADLLILDADPLEDVSALQAIHRVVKSGRVFERDELLPTR